MMRHDQSGHCRLSVHNPSRQVKMNSLRRLLRNVPVLRFGAAVTHGS